MLARPVKFAQSRAKSQRKLDRTNRTNRRKNTTICAPFSPNETTPLRHDEENTDPDDGPTQAMMALRELDAATDSLHKLAREGKAHELQMLLQTRNSRLRKTVNQLDNEGLSALHYAARFNSYDAVRVLVEVGKANVNIRNDERATPLHLAARYRRQRNDAIKKTNPRSKFHHTDGCSLTWAAEQLEHRQSFSPAVEAYIETEYSASQDAAIPGTSNSNTPLKTAVGAIRQLQDFHFPKKYEWGNVVSNAKRLLDEENLPTIENSVILYLVSKGARINEQDIYGCTPLHYAALRGNEIAAKQLLLIDGIDIEIRDKEKMTPLHVVCNHNEVEIAQMLLDKGCDLKCVQETGDLPLHMSSLSGSIEITIMLLDAAERTMGHEGMLMLLNQPDNDLNTPLHQAVVNGHLELSRLLIKKGAEVNKETCKSETPLHMAAHFGCVNLVRLLVEHGAILDELDISYRSPLHRAANRNHADIVKYLISQNANKERRDKNSYTPLLLASLTGHIDALEMLIEEGANMIVQEKTGKSCLYLAVEADQPGIVELILNSKNGILLLDVPDKYNNSPLHVACEKGFSQIVSMLVKHEAKIDCKNQEEQNPLHLAAKFGRTQIVHKLTQVGKRFLLHEGDDSSNTALHLASANGHEKVCNVLLEAGANIEARNVHKWTPLACAAIKGQMKTAELLLTNSASIDPQDKTKATPLYLAAKNGHTEVVQLLLAWGSDVSIKVEVNDDETVNGSNCLDIAIDNGHEECVRAIIKSTFWEDAMRNQIQTSADTVDTPMRKMIRKMPDVVTDVFDRCNVESNHHPDNPDFTITFNYEFLDDTYAHWGSDEIKLLPPETHRMTRFWDFLSCVKAPKHDDDTNSQCEDQNDKEGEEDEHHKRREGHESHLDCTDEEIYDDNDKLKPGIPPYCLKSSVVKSNHPLMIMADSEREALLSHPLIISLLQRKWSTFGRIVYYINLSIYMVFLLFITLYMIHSKPPYHFWKNRTVTDLLDFQSPMCEQIVTKMHYHAHSDFLVKICRYAVLVLATIAILKELVQLVVGFENYFSYDNIMEWVIYVFSITTVLDTSACQRKYGIRESWQWQTASIAIFFAWLNLLLFIRKLPRFGIYVVMFTDVVKTFLNCSMLLLFFIVSFSLSFHVMLQNQVSFRRFSLSLVKTCVMTIGELDYEKMFSERIKVENSNSTEFPHKDQMFYEGTTSFLYVAFLVCMPIIVMNMLVGLAVDDIKAVQDKAVLKRLAMQVDMTLGVEALLPDALRRRFILKTLVVYPNAEPPWYRALLGLPGNASVNGDLLNVLNSEPDDTEKLQINQSNIQSQLVLMKQRVKNVQNQNMRLTRMMNLVLEKMEVPFEELDDGDEIDEDAVVDEEEEM